MRIAIFVDGANVYSTQRRYLGWNIDLKKFLDYFRTIGEVVDAYYYTAIDYRVESQNRFVKMLPLMGYTIVSKPLKEIRNGDEMRKKGNLDVEIVLDMFNTIDNYDMAVLFSGDGDFERALQQLRARGKQFMVVAHRSTVAREILAVAGMHYLDISTIEQTVKLTALPRELQEDASLSEVIADMSVEEEYPV
jgi:uncharacterized LabA/DUF88 family protein